MAKDLFVNIEAKLVEYRANSTFQYETLSRIPYDVKEECVEDSQTSVFTLADDVVQEISFEGIEYADFVYILADGEFQVDLEISEEGYGDGGWGEGGYGGDNVISGLLTRKCFLSYGPYSMVRVTNLSGAALSFTVFAAKLAVE
jgi:hypothetical protein